jgi:hypothetical protein
MALPWFYPLLKKSRRKGNKMGHGRFLPTVEPLAERVLPAVTASFSAAGGLLRVVGDALDNTIVVSRDAAGTILVNNGAVAILGDRPTVVNTRQIMINGGTGNDTLSLDETNGALPGAALFGGAGNDVLVGGSGDDFADGGPGNDTAFLGAGDDTFSWNPGDGSDVVEGQGGRDTLAFNGSNDAERFDLSANGTRGRFTRDVGNVTMDLNAVEEIDLNAPGGGDTVTVNDQSATDLNTFNVDLNGPAGRVNGQADVVVINGTNGNDVGQIRSLGPTSINATVSAIPFVNITNTVGSADGLVVNTLGGNDVLDASDLAGGLIKLTVNGGTGNDTLTGSQGNDDFLWTPGDGRDTIEGGDGHDRIVVDGSDAADQFDVSANGTRARVTSAVDGGTVDGGGVETIVLNPLGGADTVTVNDLTGTAVTGVGVNLVATLGSAAGDGAADSVIVNGRNAADFIPIRGNNEAIFVDGGAGVASGLSFGLTITAAEGALDTLTVNALGGNDTVDASGLAAGNIKLTVNGGAGNDALTGSQGADTFVWNPGDGSDTIDGQGGIDKLAFNGSNDAERFDLSASGTHARLTRDVGGVTMDLTGLEVINVISQGGADTITVNDLTGTGVGVVNLPLGATANTGDGQPDTVIINGTDGNDAITVVGTGAGAPVVNVMGLSAQVSILNPDAPGDSLVINALGGNDTVNTTDLSAGVIGLTVNLGDGQGAAATTTTLRTSTATAVFGQTVLLTATVNAAAGTPTGTVTFLDGDTVLGMAPVNTAGQAVLAVSLAVGNHELTAVYGGSNSFTSSTSAAVTETVNPAATSVALGSSVNPAALGQAVTFTATIVPVVSGPGMPTGTVTFKDGDVVLGMVAVGTGGTATFATRFAAAGGQVITAVYSGDASFVGSSQTLTEQVSAPATLAATTTALAASANAVRVGQAVTFTATVHGAAGSGTPTGTVTFLVSGRVVARVNLGAGGRARLTGFFSVAGSFPVRAVYSGDSNFAASSQSLTERVNRWNGGKHRAGSSAAWHTTSPAPVGRGRKLFGPFPRFGGLT